MGPGLHSASYCTSPSTTVKSRECRPGLFFGLTMPTRYLKPGVRDSENIDALSPLAETLFYRLLVTVDDFGRYDGRPALVKAQCFPLKDLTPAKCSSLLVELQSNNLIDIYTVEGKPYLQLLKWDNVPRAKESKFPALDRTCIQVNARADAVNTNVPLTETETGTETKTGNRKPETDICAEPQSASPLVSMPLVDKSEFLIFSEQVEEWTASYPAVDVLQKLREMRQWCIANPAKKKTRTGVMSFIVRWLAKEQDKGGGLKSVSTVPTAYRRDLSFEERSAEAARLLFGSDDTTDYLEADHA